MREPEFYRGREQTYLKHFFLERYLERVAYNILSFKDKFVYIDGFSGPWRSKDENYGDTSFAIALNKLRAIREVLYNKTGQRKTIRCVFNDKDPTAHKHLLRFVSDIRDIEVHAVCRDFESLVPEIVSYARGSFSLTFVDPTGWSGFGLRKISPLLELQGEVLINFMFDYVNRFLEDPRPEIASTFDPLFGGAGWYEEVEGRVAKGETREDAVLDVYRERLRLIGSFPNVTSTRILKPLADRSYFYLVYGTRHWKGLVEFRDVERKAVDAQESERRAAQYMDREARSGQIDLFSAGDNRNVSRAFAEMLEKQRRKAKAVLVSKLAADGQCVYADLLASVLEVPLVSKRDVNEWLAEMKKSGHIDLPDLARRERMPKPTHRVFWLGKA